MYFIYLIVLILASAEVYLVPYSDLSFISSEDLILQNKNPASNLLESLIASMNKDKDLKITWTELGLLIKYIEENQSQIKVIKDLVASGRLDLVNGDSLYPEESLSDLDEFLYQTQNTHLKLNRQFEGIKIQVAWHTKNYAHSSLTPSIYEKFDYKYIVLSNKTLENSIYRWKGKSLGSKNSLLAWSGNDKPIEFIEKVDSKLPIFETQFAYKYLNEVQKNHEELPTLFLVPIGKVCEKANILEECFKMLKGFISSAENLKIDIKMMTISEYFRVSRNSDDIKKLPELGYRNLEKEGKPAIFASVPELKQSIQETKNMIRAAEITSSLILNKEFQAFDSNPEFYRQEIISDFSDESLSALISKFQGVQELALSEIEEAWKQILQLREHPIKMHKSNYKVLVIYNTLSWKSKELIEILTDTEYISIRDKANNTLSSQSIPKDNKFSTYFYADLEALSFSIFFIFELDNKTCLNLCSKVSSKSSEQYFTNNQIELKFNRGLLQNIIYKQNTNEKIVNTTLWALKVQTSDYYGYKIADSYKTLPSTDDYSYEAYLGDIVQVMRTSGRIDNFDFGVEIILPRNSSSFLYKITASPSMNYEIFLRLNYKSEKDAIFVFNSADIREKHYKNSSTDNYHPVPAGLFINLTDTFYHLYTNIPFSAVLNGNHSLDMHLFRNYHNIESKNTEYNFLMSFSNLDHGLWKNYINHKHEPLKMYAKDYNLSLTFDENEACLFDEDWKFYNLYELMDEKPCEYLIRSYYDNRIIWDVLNICLENIEMGICRGKIVKELWLDGKIQSEQEEDDETVVYLEKNLKKYVMDKIGLHAYEIELDEGYYSKIVNITKNIVIRENVEDDEEENDNEKEDGEDDGENNDDGEEEDEEKDSHSSSSVNNTENSVEFDSWKQSDESESNNSALLAVGMTFISLVGIYIFIRKGRHLSRLPPL